MFIKLLDCLILIRVDVMMKIEMRVGRGCNDEDCQGG
jgi:hypothetical protein